MTAAVAPTPSIKHRGTVGNVGFVSGRGAIVAGSASAEAHGRDGERGDESGSCEHLVHEIIVP